MQHGNAGLLIHSNLLFQDESDDGEDFDPGEGDEEEEVDVDDEEDGKHTVNYP